jgi:type IV secretion system protein VirD4
MAELSKNIVHFVTDKHLSCALSRENNITPEDLEFGNDVYINIPEHLLRQWKSLMTLIVNQFLTHFEQRSEEDVQPILFLLDEFPRLGKVNSMMDGLATLRSKKVTICLIIQSLEQLDTIYGRNERKVIADTCAYKAVLGASDTDTQEYFSRLAGTYDKLAPTQTENFKPYTGLSGGTSTSTHEMEKRIIKPHELGMLGDIILFTPFPTPINLPNTSTQTYAPFCRVHKLPYYVGEREE